MESKIIEILGEYDEFWDNKYTKFYYKNKKVYAMMILHKYKDGILVLTESKNKCKFTTAHLKDIVRLSNKNILYIMHEFDNKNISDILLDKYKKNAKTIINKFGIFTKVYNG